MSAAPTSSPFVPRPRPAARAGAVALLAPGAWIDSRVDCPPALRARVRAVLEGTAGDGAPVPRPDPRHPGLYDLQLDGWALCLLIYPGGHGVRILGAVPLGARPGA